MNQIVYRLFLFIILLLFFLKTPAQQTSLDFNLVRGNKNVTFGKITGITQDTWGYMWFVDQGNSQLIRYDGYRMKVFKNNPADTNSINKSGFECIAADSVGNVWFPVDGGVDRINSSTSVTTHYKLKSAVASILVDHLNFIWLGTGKGLCKLDPKTGIDTYYSHDAHDSTSISSNIIRVLYEDREGTIWAGNGFPFTPDKDGGLNKFDRTTGRFTRYMHDPNNPHSLINDKVRALLEDRKGTFWIGSQGDGLHIMNRKTGAFERLIHDPAHPEKLSRPPVAKGHSWDHITFIKEDVCGNIWIGTYEQGIVRYDPVTKKLTHFIGDKTNPNGFRDSTTWCAFTSRDGTLWIATETTTLLYRVDPFQKSITTIHTGSTASSFAEDTTGNLWAGTDGNGIFKFDEHNNEIAHFIHNPLDPSSPPENHTMISAAPNDNKIWSGHYYGVRMINAQTDKFYKVNSDSELFRDSSKHGFVSVLEDKDGVNWFATWGNGLLRYNPKDNSVKQFFPAPKDSSSISSAQLNHLLEDRQDRLWIIGIGGVHRMDRKTEKFKNYLPETFIGSIYQDSKNNIWAGTEKGLYRYDELKDTFALFFDPSSRLYSTPVGGIIEDNNHNLWLNSFSSIIRLNPLTKQFFIYSDKYGIDNNSMAPWAKPFKNKKGQLLYGYGDGFGIFYPQELEVKNDFKITVSDFFINSIPVLPGKKSVIQKPVEDLTDLDLKYNQNNIAFNFSALDYRDPESVQYLTMLAGYDNTWREVTGEKSSYYFNLPRGRYTYHIKAVNKDGTEAEKTITITVNPPWWQTWWAYTLYAVTLIIAVWSFIKWRTKLLEKEKLILERKVSERTRELKKEKEIVETTLQELKSTQAQLIQSEKMASLGELTAGIAHEIQNPLNFVNNFSEVNKELLTEMNEEIAKGNYDEITAIANDIEENEDKIIFHGKRADAIVKGMLQHSRISSGIKEPTDINALADEYFRLAYHGLRAKDKSFNATMKTDFDESIGNINIIPQDIGRVLLNLYNNAFYAVTEKNASTLRQAQTEPSSAGRHYEPTVSVSTKLLKAPPVGGHGGKIEIKVKDNGNGIPQKVLDKIFQPFFTTKPTGQGTGLGLSLGYDIIKAHGGEIKVQTKEGEGAEFIIQLPIA